MAGHSRPKRRSGRGWPEPGAARGVLWRWEPPLARRLAQGAARVLSSQLRPAAPTSLLYLPYNSPIGELLPTAVRANGAATALGVHWLCNIVIGNYFLLARTSASTWRHMLLALRWGGPGGGGLLRLAGAGDQRPLTRGDRGQVCTR